MVVPPPDDLELALICKAQHLQKIKDEIAEPKVKRAYRIDEISVNTGSVNIAVMNPSRFQIVNGVPVYEVGGYYVIRKMTA